MENGFNTDWLYIEPVGMCNLRCKLCYTKRYSKIIPKARLLKIINDFSKLKKSMKIYWCGGGELFLYRHFVPIANYVSDNIVGCKQVIQTNGMFSEGLDSLNKIEKIDFRVSIDMPRRFQEWNRGKGNFDKAMDFCRKAYDIGCGIEVRTLLVKDNIEHLLEFEKFLKDEIGERIILSATPVMLPKDTGCKNDVEKGMLFDSLEEVRNGLGKYNGRFASNNHDYLTYVSISPSGFYSCCEMINKIGDLNEDLSVIMERLKSSADYCNRCRLLKYCLF